MRNLGALLPVLFCGIALGACSDGEPTGGGDAALTATDAAPEAAPVCSRLVTMDQDCRNHGLPGAGYGCEKGAAADSGTVLEAGVCPRLEKGSWVYCCSE
jgi:hypothetical protein